MGRNTHFEKKQLIYSSYSPICSLGPGDQLSKEGFVRKYPLTVPIINDELKQIGEEKIATDRQYFSFVDKNKDKSLKHFKILYRE